MLLRRPRVSLIGLGIMCAATVAWSGCGAQTQPSEPRDTTASGSSASASQVLITFARDTSPARIEKVTRELGVRVDQKMFDRIIIGSAGSSRTIADVQNAAKKYPEIVAVEPNSTVRPQ